MKKSLCIMLCFASCLAQGHTRHQDFSGLYLTAGIGAVTDQYQVTPEFFISNPDLIQFNFLGDYDLDASSPSGLIGLGYLHQFANHFVLGLEGTAGYSKTHAGYRAVFDETLYGMGEGEIDLSSHTTAELTADFALLFKAGYASGPHTLFYGMVGPRWGHIKTSTTAHMLLSFPPDSFTAEGSASESGFQLGYTVGGGIQQRVTEQLHINLEYAYTHYGEIDAPEVEAPILFDGFIEGDFVQSSPEIEASTNSLMLEISYQW